MITRISPDEVVRLSREALGLSYSSGIAIDDAMLAASVRRAAAICCPCSTSTLSASVLEALQYLMGDNGNLVKSVADVIEGLIIGGDLLELNQVTIDDPTAKGSWVFPAPPGFIVKGDGSVFIVGVVPDEVTPLPTSLNASLVHEGFVRVLMPKASEDLPAVLRDLGLRELSVSAWLKGPKPESATELRDKMFRRLLEQPPSGFTPDVSILDPMLEVEYYRGRWANPTNQSGNYLARRPQAYGAPLWGVASVIEGIVTRFLDLPLKGSRWRGCDIAWYLQMAIDHCRGTPQVYRLRSAPNGVCLDFFSPLPLWAQRRLILLGRLVPRNKCLMSYWLPERELKSEETFLRERLWLARRENSE